MLYGTYCYIIIENFPQKFSPCVLEGVVLLLNTWASQQHKYIKHGGCEPGASKKTTLGQVVPNFTWQVVSSKILRIFR